MTTRLSLIAESLNSSVHSLIKVQHKFTSGRFRTSSHVVLRHFYLCTETLYRSEYPVNVEITAWTVHNFTLSCLCTNTSRLPELSQLVLHWHNKINFPWAVRLGGSQKGSSELVLRFNETSLAQTLTFVYATFHLHTVKYCKSFWRSFSPGSSGLVSNYFIEGNSKRLPELQ